MVVSLISNKLLLCINSHFWGLNKNWYHMNCIFSNFNYLLSLKYITSYITFNIGRNGKFSQTPPLLLLLCREDPDDGKIGLRYFVNTLCLLKCFFCVSCNSLGRGKSQEWWWQILLAEPWRGCFSMVNGDSCKRVDSYYSAVVPYNLHLLPRRWLQICP